MKFNLLLLKCFILSFLLLNRSICAIEKAEEIKAFFEAYPRQVEVAEKEILYTFPMLRWCDCNTLSKNRDNAPFRCKIYLQGTKQILCIHFKIDNKNEKKYYFKLGNRKKIGMCYTLLDRLPCSSMCILKKTSFLYKYDPKYKELGLICSLLTDFEPGKKLKNRLSSIDFLINWMIMDRLERCTYIELHEI